MNDIAAICLHYEDFRYELEHLQKGIDVARLGSDYEAYYWIRRALLTINEFRGMLKRLTSGQNKRYLLHNLTDEKRQAIHDCKRAISNSPLEKLRNHFGGHIDSKMMGRGIKFLGPDAISHMTWSDTRDRLPLDIKFANDIFRGAFAGFFAKNVDELQSQLQIFYRELGAIFLHVAIATHILVHDFIWLRMQ